MNIPESVWLSLQQLSETTIPHHLLMELWLNEEAITIERKYLHLLISGTPEFFVWPLWGFQVNFLQKDERLYSFCQKCKDQRVRSIKAHMPHAGYRLIKGFLQASGHHIPWRQIMRSLQHENGAGVTFRMVQLSSIDRHTDSVPAPLTPFQHISQIDKVKCPE